MTPPTGERESSSRLWPSGVRIMAISTRWSPSPVTRPAHSTFHHGSPLEFEAELAKELDRRCEVLDDDADVVHPFKCHVPNLHCVVYVDNELPLGAGAARGVTLRSREKAGLPARVPSERKARAEKVKSEHVVETTIRVVLTGHLSNPPEPPEGTTSPAFRTFSRSHEHAVRTRVSDTASGAEPGRPRERRRDALDGLGPPRLVLVRELSHNDLLYRLLADARPAGGTSLDLTDLDRVEITYGVDEDTILIWLSDDVTVEVIEQEDLPG
jgi:hypothetical protein